MTTLLTSSTTPEVAGESHYWGTPLLLGFIAALVVVGIIYFARLWCRRNSTTVSPDLSQQEAEEEESPPEIISTSWSYGDEEDDMVYFPPPNNKSYIPSTPPRYFPTPKPSATTTSHPIYQVQTLPSNTGLPNLQETHFCPHSREPPLSQSQEQQQPQNVQLTLHSAPTRPKPLTPPPSNTSTPSVLTPQKSYNSARSITPRSRHQHRYEKNKVAPTPAPQPLAPMPREPRSDDVNEQSSTANMMAMNKMSKADAKRMRRHPSRKRPPIRPAIRRPQPVSAEAITAASTTLSTEEKIIPSQDFKDHPRQHLFSQEHVVDFQKGEPMMKSDVTQNDDETVEMPPKKM